MRRGTRSTTYPSSGATSAGDVIARKVSPAAPLEPVSVLTHRLSTISISESPTMLAASPPNSRANPGTRNAARITGGPSPDSARLPSEEAPRLTEPRRGAGGTGGRSAASGSLGAAAGTVRCGPLGTSQPTRDTGRASGGRRSGAPERSACRCSSSASSPRSCWASAAVSHTWDCTSPVASRQAGGSVSRAARAARSRWTSRSTSMSVSASAATCVGASTSSSFHSRASLTARHRRSRPVPPGASRTKPCAFSLRRCHEQLDGDCPSNAAAPVAVIGPSMINASSSASRSGCDSAFSAAASVTRRRVSGIG